MPKQQRVRSAVLRVAKMAGADPAFDRQQMRNQMRINRHCRENSPPPVEFPADAGADPLDRAGILRPLREKSRFSLALRPAPVVPDLASMTSRQALITPCFNKRNQGELNGRSITAGIGNRRVPAFRGRKRAAKPYSLLACKSACSAEVEAVPFAASLANPVGKRHSNRSQFSQPQEFAAPTSSETSAGVARKTTSVRFRHKLASGKHSTSQRAAPEHLVR